MQIKREMVGLEVSLNKVEEVLGEYTEVLNVIRKLDSSDKDRYSSKIEAVKGLEKEIRERKSRLEDLGIEYDKMHDTITVLRYKIKRSENNVQA